MSDETSMDRETKPSEDDSIGYGKPPVRSRFKKGQSGNPTGRRNGAKNLKTDIEEELQEPVMVREGTRATRISKQRAIVKTLVNKTLKGDTAAARTLLSTMNKLCDPQQDLEDGDVPLDAEDIEVLAAFEKRVLARAEAVGGAAPITEARPTDQLAGRAAGGPAPDRDHDIDEQS